MEQMPLLMSEANMIRASQSAQQRVQAWLDHAAEVQADAKKPERQQRLECKACFYAGRIGGAAMTYRKCMSCASRELYGSTNTDVLCAPCATAGDLCKHCGGDREMRVLRNSWPVAYRSGQE